MSTVQIDEECDALVFGSGAAGMAAAVVCAREGLKTIVCEKSSQLGGTTSTSGGVVWIPVNRHLLDAGLADNREIAEQFLQHVIGKDIRPELLETFLEMAPKVIDYLEEYTDVKFELGRAPDYYDFGETPILGRALSPKAFDGRLLGKDFSLVRGPWPQFLVLGGLMVDRVDIDILLKPFASMTSFRRACSVLLRHARDRLRYPRGTHLVRGNALIARFLYSLRAHSCTVHTDARLVGLEKHNGRVEIACVEMQGAIRRIRARRGIVLATGGFPQNPVLRDELMPEFPHEHSIAFEANTGDSILAVRTIGAAIDAAMESPAFWTACTVMERSDGRKIVYPYGYLDRGKPGLIIVDQQGERFVNESDSYHDVALALFKRKKEIGSIRAFQIFDSRFLKEYGLGLIRPNAPSLRRFLQSRYLIRAKSIKELAQILEIDAAKLSQTVARHNKFCASGVDEDFGKGNTTFNRYNGDKRLDGNPCLAPIGRPPFYAVAIHPGTLGTGVGIKTDSAARVLDMHDTPLGGLYACGNDMGSVMRGSYPGAGITLGPAITFGFAAAMHIIGKNSADI